MILDSVLWIILGAVAGWIASIIMGTNEEQGTMLNIVVGIVGAFVGGFILRLMTGESPDGLSIGGLITAAVSHDNELDYELISWQKCERVQSK